MRVILAMAAIVLTFGAAGAAHAQSASSTQPITKQQARYDAAAAGYAYISHLKKDANGNWAGAGTKGDFIVTPTGKVIPQ